MRRWERMREDVEFYPLENVRSYLRISNGLQMPENPWKHRVFGQLCN